MNIVQPDGKCKKCLHKVFANFLTCLSCKQKFHATGCSDENNICTPTFLDSFKHFSEKNTPKYAARPGNFHFLCDPCITNFEISQCATSDSKVDDLKTKVDNLETSLNDIKTLLMGNKGTTSPAAMQVTTRNDQYSPTSVVHNGTNEYSPTSVVHQGTNSENVWNLQNRFSPLAQFDPNADNDFTVPSESALIIKASEDIDLEKTRMKALNKAVMQSKVSISKSYKKKNGETVIVCDTTEKIESLKTHILQAVPDIEIKNSDIRKCSVRVAGLHDNYSGSDLISAMIDQNFFLKAFFETNEIESHIKHYGTKPFRKDPNRYQATFRISKQLRHLLNKHNDRLIVGIISCKIYDRAFVKRCFKCQRFGHFSDKCENDPKCAECGGDHETRDCTNKDADGNNIHPLKCVNCKRAGLEVN